MKQGEAVESNCVARGRGILTLRVDVRTSLFTLERNRTDVYKQLFFSLMESSFYVNAFNQTSGRI